MLRTYGPVRLVWLRNVFIAGRVRTPRHVRFAPSARLARISGSSLETSCKACVEGEIRFIIIVLFNNLAPLMSPPPDVR